MRPVAAAAGRAPCYAGSGRYASGTAAANPAARSGGACTRDTCFCTSTRQRNAALYTKLLTGTGVGAVSPTDAEIASGDKEMPGDNRLALPADGQRRHIYNQYTVRVHGDGRRDELRDFLTERRVGTEIYYPVPLHLQKCFASLGGAEGDLAVSEKAAGETLALPIFPELSTDEITYVCDQIREFYESVDHES